ncbi:MAG TPA: trehalose-6-phosphate synthase, partial [Actinomycetota bacterium]|nr:trehalose-6-phosphate synthase [Actinomycetota bacterium]
ISTGVIEGMLGADLVGLHISRWCDNFVACCEALGAAVDRSKGTVSHNGTTSWVRSYPIPIDASDLTARANIKPVSRWASRFRESIGDGRLIVRVDRSEPSKNIVRGFEAFGLLLDRRADLRSRVRFVACVYPSRQTMSEYRRYSERIQAAVDDVNRRYPDSIQLFTEDDFDRSLGAQLAYDVLLVNPIMDGMNLVSKEGPTINQREGVLVLSSGAGSFEELGEAAIEINDPLDVEETSTALERALELPDRERRERARVLRARATGTKPENWIEAQLADLRSIADTGEPVSSPPAL